MTTICNESLGAASASTLIPPEEALSSSIKEKDSYRQILKSSALIGGSQAVNIGVGIVRTKAMALLLGPAGFGMAGLFGSISDLAVAVAGMGVNSSGVRQIAEAVGSKDVDRIAKTIAVLRRTSIVLGLIGALLLAAFAKQISVLTFSTPRYSAAVALLGLAVFLKLVSAGQGALLQGMRSIGDLARMGVIGAVSGAVFSTLLVYFFREEGIVPSLIAVAATAVLTSWWYSRKVRIQIPRIKAVEVADEAGELLKLGFVFMSSGLMVMGTAYVTRIILLHKVGIEGTGLYQAAWTIGGLYVGFILQAMGADFYPRLTENHQDNDFCNRLVNEQTHVGLLLAGPGVIATITFAPLVLSVLYSGKFSGATDLLRWICLGTLLQVITWPMGFIIVAKGNKRLFFLAEFAWTVVAIALAWFCVKRFGLNGAGIAFFASYVFHAMMVYPIVYVLSGFRFHARNIQLFLLLGGCIGLVLCIFRFSSPAFAILAAIPTMIIVIARSASTFTSLLCGNSVPLEGTRFE